MGAIAKTIKGTRKMTGQNKEKDQEKDQERDVDARGEERSQNEKTLSKVFKAIGQVVATVVVWLVQMLWPLLLVVALVLFIGALLSSFLELFNWETDKDTDTAVINTGIIIDTAISDDDFVNEILDMINQNTNIDEIYNKIKDKLEDEGMKEEDAEIYKEQVLQTIQTYGRRYK